MSDPVITLLMGDCLEKMQKIPDGGIDLTVTSPPYDNLRSYNGNIDRWGEHIWKNVIADLYRVTADGGVVVWVVGDATIKGSETGTSFKQALWAKECGFNLHDTMIWEKPHFANPSANRCHQIFEYMFVFSKGKPKTFNQIKDVPIKYGAPKGKSSQRHVDGSITNSNDVRGSLGDFGARRNIWRINTAGQENFGKKCPHPAMFSVQLANDHVISWSKEGDTVLDPFMGSGTTGVVAKNLNRNFIGIELDPEYFKISQDRIKNTHTTS